MSTLPQVKTSLGKINQHRRTFLRFLGVGALGFLASRILSLISEKPAPLQVGEQKDFRHFRVAEEGGSLIFYNAEGSRLFMLHGDGELEIG